MKPYIWTDQDIDTMAQVETVECRADALRPGMVLVDPDLLTPDVAVDHRMPATRGTGDVRFLVADLDAGGWTEITLRARAQIQVMAVQASR